MQENLETMNQEVILFLLRNKVLTVKKNPGRIFLILPFFCLSISGFTQETPKEIIISDFEYQKIDKRYMSVRGTRILPSSHSLKQFAPKPLNQLDYPTSPAWATAYGALTIIDAQQTNKTGRKITESAFSPLYAYYQSVINKNWKENKEAISIAQVLNTMKRNGTPKYIHYPVRWPTHTPDRYRTEASKNKVSEYARLFDVGESSLKKIKAIKTTLVENMPVVIAMHYDKSFKYAKEFWQPRESFNRELNAKALCVVGYDDNKYGGAFEVMNSQGAEWGNDGFMWIPYETFINYTRQAFSLYMIPSKNSNIQLSGGIELELVNGGKMELIQISPGYYKIKKAYPSGTQFKVKIVNHSTGFLYVFASDLTEKIFPFFPPALTSAAFSTEASFYVPDENTPLEIDETIGTDYLCVLFSKEDLDISTIYETIAKTSGNFKEKVVASVKESIISSDQIKYKPTSADFVVSKSENSVVILIIEHEHN